ncbi:DUF1801 domain-containing protein [Paenibacillus sp. UMB4589-SE434]|uniref:DUF1801 domain-containing protein n=1 Tax=Paenibacillus sp. UMB4589-SE434 TaxID=3046314 RepID=UPI0025517AB3|nr:DUF1801 domain-containing protein [Paenibacillus sp. UMB4589-SE434]MDK8181772.1 DUF1801 domain-containing protein [Paenibacillus sp. UMB4589-SE434]
MTQNPEVVDFIAAIKEPWQKELAVRLRDVVHQALPDALERIQYKKPHFLKNGKYVAVISTSKDAVSFTIFNATGLILPEGLFEGPPERKTIKIRQGHEVDMDQLLSLVRQATETL